MSARLIIPYWQTCVYFRNRCVEDPDLSLNDGTQKIILNTKGIFDDVRPELKRLLNFIDGRQPEDSFTQDLSKAVESAKRNEKWRHDYMTLQMAYDEKYREGLETGIQQGIERGIEQGIEQGITTSARRMLSSGKYRILKFLKLPDFRGTNSGFKEFRKINSYYF